MIGVVSVPVQSFVQIVKSVFGSSVVLARKLVYNNNNNNNNNT